MANNRFEADQWFIDNEEFPSPCGVNIVANLGTSFTFCLVLSLVSVPLRGKYRGEFVLRIRVRWGEVVSVPLRGKYRGELRLAIEEKLDFLSFRPLAG